MPNETELLYLVIAIIFLLIARLMLTRNGSGQR